jgi:GTP cyclohydrolase IA
MTMETYMKRFPSVPIESASLAETRARKARGRTYEERYGKKAERVKELRSISARLQMRDPLQRDLRRESAKYVRTVATREKLSESKTEHGGGTYRQRALKHYGRECDRCGRKSKDASVFHVHHVDWVHTGTELTDNSLENLRVLCKSCHRKLHNELSKCSKKFYGIRSIEKGVHYLFKGLKLAFKLDLKDDNFKETPQRVARAYAEIFEGVENTDAQVKDILATGFPCESSQMVLIKDIRAFSMCPHHLLPVDYTITVAYLPSRKKHGKVLGLSKLARLVEILARRPVLQEKLVHDVASALMTLKGCRGAACLAKGRHYCMIMRGVKQPDSVTVTSSLKGAFLTNATVRGEFLSLARKKGSEE